MLEPIEILELFSSSFTQGAMSGKNVLITAGPTQEPIDPVRFITNKSSGKMGYSLAEAAIESGARVTLISGPVNLETPPNCHKVSVETAKEMHEAVMHHIKGKDVYIGTAAVSDYSPAEVKNSKIKKDGSRSPLNLKLKENQDILKSVSGLEERPYVVGFAAETDDLIENAENKLKNKGLDLIVANDVSNEEIGFDSDENEVTLITKTDQQLIPRQSKKKISKKIVEFISRRINEQNN
jgi:phosphopantothenoylcysteine decarboxylase/phosphopantothenate--cysteine ligase